MLVFPKLQSLSAIYDFKLGSPTGLCSKSLQTLVLNSAPRVPSTTAVSGMIQPLADMKAFPSLRTLRLINLHPNDLTVIRDSLRGPSCLEELSIILTSGILNFGSDCLARLTTLRVSMGAHGRLTWEPDSRFFNSLRECRLHRVKALSDEMLEALANGCAHLETLNITDMYFNRSGWRLHLRNSSLIWLTLAVEVDQGGRLVMNDCSKLMDVTLAKGENLESDESSLMRLNSLCLKGLKSFRYNGLGCSKNRVMRHLHRLDLHTYDGRKEWELDDAQALFSLTGSCIGRLLCDSRLLEVTGLSSGKEKIRFHVEDMPVGIEPAYVQACLGDCNKIDLSCRGLCITVKGDNDVSLWEIQNNLLRVFQWSRYVK